MYNSVVGAVLRPRIRERWSMYEREVNYRVETVEGIPPEVLSRFREYQGRISARTLLPWSEHCTECVWPTCYTTCDLYSPREDGKCRRFTEGMVRVDGAPGFQPYLLKIRFKRWGKLYAVGNIRLHSLQDSARVEDRDQL